MTTKRQKPEGDELRQEYDLSALKGGVRGMYYQRALAEGVRAVTTGTKPSAKRRPAKS